MKRWTDYQINYLKDNYGKLDIDTIANAVGRTALAVNLKACGLGMTRQVKYTHFK